MRIFKTLVLAAIFQILVPAASGFCIEIPKEIGGFRLGEDITEYSDIEYSNYLKEVVVTDWHGFRNGVISYGICAAPGKIVRISMKYEDSSKDFFDTLLKKYKDKFGKPLIWGGDAFGILTKWKWVFIDENNTRVNLILQHNLRNHNENIGNMVKLYYPEREQEERLCFIEQCEINKTEEQQKEMRERQEMNWDYLIPR
ncbi:MAG: hypothetical protein V2I35_07825 [Desulfocapsaceae bacterium]|jgi:hypothetical protein|nr:hypothetical protein [Desulfocapsaceae bacterium]